MYVAQIKTIYPHLLGHHDPHHNHHLIVASELTLLPTTSPVHLFLELTVRTCGWYLG